MRTRFDHWVAQSPGQAMARGQAMAQHAGRLAVHFGLGLVMFAATWIAHLFVLQRNSGAAISYLPITIETILALFSTATSARLAKTLVLRRELHVIGHCVVSVSFTILLTLIALWDIVPMFAGY